MNPSRDGIAYMQQRVSHLTLPQLACVFYRLIRLKRTWGGRKKAGHGVF
jgi:hypothetical protein